MDEQARPGQTRWLRRLLGLLGTAFLAVPMLALEATQEDLQDLQRFLEQPVQAASKRSQRLKEAPADVTVLRGQDLAEQGYRTLGEALGGVLGLGTHQDRAYTGLAVRGLYVLGDQNSRVLILLDGHALSGAAEVGASKVGEDFGIPMDLVERIEVIRGPASSLYGSGAFLGMVNVVTREPEPGPAGGAGIATGSSRSLAGLDGVLGGTAGAVRWQAVLSGMQRRGTATRFPELGPMEVPADADREERQSAYLRILGPDWSLAGYAMDRTQRLASAPFLSAIGSDRNRYRNRLSFLEGRCTPSFGPLAILARAYGDRNEFSGEFYTDGQRAPAPRGLFTESDPNWSLGGELQARLSLGQRFLVTAGREQSWQRFSTRSRASWADIDGAVRHQVANTYLQAEWTPSEVLAVTAGVQYAAWTVSEARLRLGTTTIAQPLVELGGTTPRLALVWQPTAVDIGKLLYGGGYRNPTIFETYYQDDAFYLANPGLQPERIDTLQGMWVHIWPAGLQGQLSLSRSWWRRLVQVAELSGALQQYRNDPDRLVGTALEGELQGRWAGWGVYAQAGWYRWVQAGRRFPDSTSCQGALRLTRRWSPAWSASAELRLVGARQNAGRGADAPAAAVLRLASRWDGRRAWIRAVLEDAGQARRTDLVGEEYAPITRMSADGRTLLLTVGVPF
jgi:iron complex outermembrane receptor protein